MPKSTPSAAQLLDLTGARDKLTRQFDPKLRKLG
jgi:hypothetical protein